jgi:hypothetical protein
MFSKFNFPAISMKKKFQQFVVLAGCLLSLGLASFAEVRPDDPPPPDYNPINANAVRPPALPAPPWIHANRRANDTREELPDAPWPGPAKVNESELSERDAARFAAFDFNALPPDEYPIWRERWRAKCKVEDSKDAMTMLVRLKDGETVNWLLSQLEQGQARSADAARILGDSGQEWLIPRLEKTLFLKPENEPVDENSSDISYGSVSEYSLKVLVEVVAKSRVFTPRLKSWFKLVFEGWGSSGTSVDNMALLRSWFELNRESLTAGNFRKLGIPPLWPGDQLSNEDMDTPFSLSDLLTIINFTNGSIQLEAMRAIGEWKLTSRLNQTQAEQIGSYLKSENSEVARAAYNLLVASGDRGVPVFAAVFADQPEKTPQGNVQKILESKPYKASERARCIAAIAADSDHNYFSNHKSLRVEAFPILNRRLNDPRLSDAERRSALSHLERLSIPKDLAFFENLLKPEHPKFIRTSAVAWICRNFTPDTMPLSVRNLTDDPAIGDSIKYFLAAADSAVETRRMREEEMQDLSRFDDNDLIARFTKMCGSATSIGERAFAAEQLARSGEQGMTLLKLTLTMSDNTARGCAAKALLEAGVGDQNEQDAFLVALVMGSGAVDNPVSDFLIAREDLHAKAMPLLKQRVLENVPGLSPNDFAAILAANLASRDDVPFFLSLLDPRFSQIIRSTAVHAIYRLLPDTDVPKSVKSLVNDKDLGEMMRICHYGE